MPTFYSHFKNSSVVNTICIDSFHYYRDYLCEISNEANVATDEGNGQMKLEYLDKVGSECELNPCLIAQSVRASEQNSMVVGSNPTQANFL